MYYIPVKPFLLIRDEADSLMTYVLAISLWLLKDSMKVSLVSEAIRGLGILLLNGCMHRRDL